jgi:hypothetical protein
VFGFGVCWELNLEPDIINCARRSAIGIGMCVERVEGLLNFKIVGVLDPRQWVRVWHIGHQLARASASFPGSGRQFARTLLPINVQT